MKLQEVVDYTKEKKIKPKTRCAQATGQEFT
jgi:hypothetical protein